MEGDGGVLDIDSVSNVVQRNECFLASVDLNEHMEHRYPAVDYLNRDSYIASDGTIE